jgi:hypothetical protein
VKTVHHPFIDLSPDPIIKTVAYPMEGEETLVPAEPEFFRGDIDMVLIPFFGWASDVAMGEQDGQGAVDAQASVFHEGIFPYARGAYDVEQLRHIIIIMCALVI